VEAVRACPNIFLETCTSFGEHGTIEFLVEGAGADRVLFGSDMPLMDARYNVGRIATANISEEDKRKVLGLNAMRLLGLEI
jgi:predicted TIM-barrel fold metal-dependent hydrolase